MARAVAEQAWRGTASMFGPTRANHPSRPSRVQLQSRVPENINTPRKRHTARVKCTGNANTQLPSGPLTGFFTVTRRGYDSSRVHFAKSQNWLFNPVFCPTAQPSLQCCRLCCLLLPKLNPPPANFTSPVASGLSHHKAAFHYNPQT